MVMSSLAVPPLTVPVPAWGRWVGDLAAPRNACKKRRILLRDNASAIRFSFPGRWTASTCMQKCSGMKKKTSEEVHHLLVSAIATVEDLHNRHVITVTPD